MAFGCELHRLEADLSCISDIFMPLRKVRPRETLRDKCRTAPVVSVKPQGLFNTIGTFGSAGVVGNDHLNVKMEGFVETDCQPICCIGSVACCAPIAVGLCRASALFVAVRRGWDSLTRKLYVFENLHKN